MDFMKPETYLDPGELASVDQWEMDVKVHAEGCIEMMREIEAESGPQSLSVWAMLIYDSVDADKMSAVLAYLILKEARSNTPEAGEGIG